jgi:hypothetical protein
MARGLKPLPQSEDRPFAPLIETAQLLRTWLARGTLILVCSTLLFMYAIKLWRRTAPQFAGDSLARVAYRAELDRLAELSLSRRFGETRERFAERIAPVSPSFALLTHQHLAAKFSRDARIDKAVLRSLSRKVAEELRGGVAWWRRWLGALLPWSWLWSR